MLSTAGLLDVLDSGEGLSVPERALAILAAVGLAGPDSAALSVGQRDRTLLSVQRSLYGPLLSGLTHCAECDSPIEIKLEVDALEQAMRGPEADAGSTDGTSFAFEHGSLSCRYRLPQSRDHVAVLAASTPEAARQALLRDCISDVWRDGEKLDVDDLRETETAAIGLAIETRDPGAIVTVKLTCPACGADEICVLDPPSFLWRRLESDARRLLYQVHALARAYGWREADVLALTARRRQRYLQLVSS